MEIKKNTLVSTAFAMRMGNFSVLKKQEAPINIVLILPGGSQEPVRGWQKPLREKFWKRRVIRLAVT